MRARRLEASLSRTSVEARAGAASDHPAQVPSLIIRRLSELPGGP